MATHTDRVSIANPARRRKMSAKQIRFFGSKRQRAALKARNAATRPSVIGRALRNANGSSAGAPLPAR